MNKFILMLINLVVLCFANWAWASPTNGFCQDFQLSDIPVGNFHQPLTLPQSTLRVTQEYNTSLEEGYCMVGNSQPSGDSPLCAGKKIYYGHDGLDLHPQGAPAGQEDVRSVLSGMVVASHSSGSFTGWGESIIIATRTNAYSEEILTLHYHHLYYNDFSHTTSRLFGACDDVSAGSMIAKEGGTPDWPTHLHFSIKRWANLQELQNKIQSSPNGFYGSGYTFGDNSKIANFLDPQGFLLDTFEEFETTPNQFVDWQWSYPYIREMRSQGWMFGDFDGSFGVTKEVKRREAARWIKQAMRLANNTPSNAHFYDMPLTDKDAPYVEALLNQGVSLPVINPNHSCTSTGTNFCPDQSITRAEALKMIITGFYQDEFIEVYNNWVWEAAAPLANNLLSHFTDVSPYSWYAPYIYFAWQNGLTGGGAIFNPNLPIKRAELAKWLVMGAEHRFGSQANFCQNVQCLPNHYCSLESHNCEPTPNCLPQENLECPLGGGYQVGGGSSSSGSGGSPPSNLECQPGQDQLQLCPDNQTASYRVCQSDGQWNAWNPQCPSTSGSTSSGGNTSSGAGGAGGSSSSSSSGSTSGSGGSGGMESCEISYYISPSGASCYSNPAGSGSPTLCLETQPLIGSQTSWRLCKQNSTFQNTYTYELLDQNHFSQFLGGQQNGPSGQSCTPWENADFSYLSQNGPQYGAGLRIEVHSPSGCTSSSCTYYSGITTVYRDCE